MKKLLKLLFALSTTTTLPLTVSACKQESLDSTLKIIYDGNTKFVITDFLDDESIAATIDSKDLSVNNRETLAKGIAEKILTDHEPAISIVWYDQNLDVNQTCYDFKITNGKKDDDKEKQEDENDVLIWDVDGPNQRIAINISYYVGTVNQNKEFEAKQRINMTFNIKVGTSESDKLLEKWILSFNSKNWNSTNPIAVDLTSQSIDLPKVGTDWSDLEREVITKTYGAIDSKLDWDGSKNPSKSIQNTNDKISDEHLLKVQLNVNLGEAEGKTEDFYIKFI